MGSHRAKIITILIGSLCLFHNIGTTGEEIDSFWRETYGWSVSFGGARNDAGYGVVQTQDGGFLVGGVTNSFGSGFCDVYVVKTDSSGKQQWAKTYGGPQSDYGNSVCRVQEGGYLLVGSTWSYGDGEADAYLVRIDSAGEQMWFKTFGGPLYERASAAHEAADGGFVVTGWTASSGKGGFDIFLLRLDEEGKEKWSATYGGISDDYGYDVLETKDGGFILAGSSVSFGNRQMDAYVVKVDERGEITWMKLYGGSGDDYGRAILQTTDGGYMLAGYSNSFGSGGADAYFVRIDSLGDTLWTRTCGGEKTDGCASIAHSLDGGFAAVGWSNSMSEEFDAYFVEMDSMGTLVRTRMFGDESREKAYAITATEDGGFAITGFSFSFTAGHADVFLSKLLP